MEGPGADLQIVGLNNQAAFARPKRLEGHNEILKIHNGAPSAGRGFTEIQGLRE
jgi:hypothetical protein